MSKSMPKRTSIIISACGVFGLPAFATAQDASPAKSETVQETKALPGPKYLTLRWNEDFSYLDGETGSYEPDFFDPIKNIHLGADWRLSIGGEFRFRLESVENTAFDSRRRTQDTFQLYRYLLHFDLEYRDTLRFFVQGISAFEEDRQLPDRSFDENRWDVHQAFVDIKILGSDRPLTLRVGRQELHYGNQRLVSPFEWGNTRRRFDAVKLFAHGDTWDVDMWYAKLVLPERIEGDDWDRNVDFYGLYVTYKGIERHGIDAYFLAIDDTANRMNPNGRAGDRSLYTIGTRFWGKTAPWDYEAELAGQWGTWAGDTIQAWMLALDAGYTFSNCPSKPRIGAGFDYASGDDYSDDRKVGTFNQLFPLGHKYFGFLDLVARQNIMAINLNMSFWPVPKKVQGRIAYHAFWLDAEDDALYNAGGGVVRRDAFGRSGNEVGQEIDVTVKWKLNRHTTMLFGWSHFFDDNFIHATGPSEDPDLFYVQYQYKF